VCGYWRGLEQSLIDDAVDQWPTRLRACVLTNGGHFEHTLIVTVNLLSLYLMNCMFHSTLDAVGNIIRVPLQVYNVTDRTGQTTVR